MQYFYRLLFLIVLTPFFASAQSNFKPGYIVTSKGDTLRGFLDYRGRDVNPKSINFKSSLNNKTVENYTTATASAFAVTGLEYFNRFTVPVSTDQVDMANIKQGADTSFITATVFLRMLSKGKNIVLYNYTDNLKTRYYISDTQDNIPRELSYRIYYSPVNNTLVKTETRYRVQLELLAQKYHPNDDKLEKLIPGAQYSDGDLVQITRIINGNTNSQFTPEKRFGTRFFVGAGVTDNIQYYRGEINFSNNSSINPKVEAGVDFFPNKNTQQFFFRVELAYTASQHSFSNTAQSITLGNISETNFVVSPLVIYNIYNSDKVKFFIGTGFNVNLSSYSNYKFTQTINNLIPLETDNYPELLKKWVSFPIKTGVTINKKIELYFCYSVGTTLTDDYDTFLGAVSEYQAGINFLFGAK